MWIDQVRALLNQRLPDRAPHEVALLREGGRNRVFLASSRTGHDYVVKWGGPGRGLEARWYQNHGGLVSLHPILSDPGRHVVVLPYSKMARTALAAIARNPLILVTTSECAGRMLRCLHHTRSQASPAPAHQMRLPYPPLRSMADAGDRTLALIRQAQASAALVRSVSVLHETPATASLIHGDAKLDNVLLCPETPAFIDWELWGRGDPRRDVGAFLGSVLWTWLGSARMPDGGIRAGHSGVAYSTALAAVHAFVGSYTASEAELSAGVGAFVAQFLLDRAWLMAALPTGSIEDVGRVLEVAERAASGGIRWIPP